MTGLPQGETVQFSSFLEIRNNGVEQGYNTDGALQQNQLDTQNSTHSILLAEVPIFVGDGSGGTVEGTPYRVFHLNIAEAGTDKQFLSLDSFQVWQEEAGNLANFTPDTGFAGTHTNYLAYNLDAGGDHWVGLAEQPDNGNGAQQAEFTVLIPDADFINDPSHRYVTLYTKFGLQAGWAADSGSEEWSLDGPSGGPVSAMVVHKTASVPGGTANAVGEVISYDVTVANVGNTDLTGITVTDPSVTNLAPVLSGGFNIGDTNHDNVLSTGETWDYTASYTVTQNDIDTLGGGDGQIENTVTADSAQTSPVSATASVVVENNAHVTMTKTADVSSVDGAGDLIHYAIAVTNDGNITVSNPDVQDSQVNIVTPITDPDAPILSTNPLLAPVLNGEFNVGDTNQNGVQDPGETFVFKNAGDENGNGIQDPGETFLFANVGDTNQNGAVDTGEMWQFYNVGDTNHNGVQDPGETFQFNVSHQATSVDANNDGFNDGDTNHNGAIDVGETWQYSVTYTVTQDDIDNGGVVDPALTHDNTATITTDQTGSGSASATVAIVQDPRVSVTKTATVADGTADAAGDVINYAIDVHNAGNMTLTSPVVIDASVTNLTLVSGDTDGDGKIDVGETWHYTASHTVTQAEIDNGGVVDPTLARDNTVTVTTAQSEQNPNGDPDAAGSASASVPIVQHPDVALTKSASVADGTADAAGDVINYTIDVSNTGNMTLTGVSVTDPSVSNLTLVGGDANNDGKLDLTETWHYTASHTVTQADIDNGGVVNAALAYSNTASVSTAQGASDSASASVPIVQDPHVLLDKTATVPGDTADTVGEVISYAISVQNTGNMTLTNPVVTDASVSDLAYVSGDTNSDGKIDVGETWHYTASHTVTQADLNAGGTIDNTASVATDQGASSSDSTSVTVVQPATSGISIDDINGLSQLSDPGGDGPSVGDLIQFFFQITNLGTTTLTSMAVSDTLGDAVAGSLQTAVPTTLAGGAVFVDTFNHTITSADLAAHHVLDDITVNALDPSSTLQTSTWHYDFHV
jgi:uncharacterized repeat protein (TIGR01451 family)